MTSPTYLSVVVPMYNEEEAIGPLVEATRQALESMASWELVLVNDGSTDATPELADRIVAEDPRVRTIHLARSYGQSVAMQAGFDHARGRIVVTMDGDLQNDPRDIPRLVEKLESGYDLVTGYRANRQDKWLTRRLPSRVANLAIGRLTGTRIRDSGCTLKAYRAGLLEQLKLYSDRHRFIPALAGSYGAQITEIPVRHHPRRYGESKYGLSRILSVFVDLVTLKMLVSYRLNPLRGFGIAALLAFGVALVFGIVAAIAVEFTQPKAEALVFPAAAVLWLSVAFYLLMLGLVAYQASAVERTDSQNPLLWEVR